MLTLIRRLATSQDGVAMPFFAMALPAFLGLALIVIDVGRGNNLHLDLQNAADALAIAAAAELDGDTDAFVRAERAIATLTKNQARFGDGGAVIIDSVGGEGLGEAQLTVRFLDELPASDDDPIPDALVVCAIPAGSLPDCAGADPANARFAWVTITPVSYSVLFPLGFLDVTSVNVSASAVAGSNPIVCEVTPMFVCNPYEGMAFALEDAVEDPGIRRRMILMRQKGQHSAWGPGNFGYLKPVTGNLGASAVREMFAVVRPKTCFAKNGVELSTGQQSTIRVGVNVRFDIYGGSMGSYSDNPNYRPARSVRKQYKPHQSNVCNASLNANQSAYRRLPRDGCFATGTCPDLGGRMGDGMWNVEDYWTVNFPGHPIPNGWNNANPPPRYEVYRYEIDNGLTNVASVGDGGPGERGAPACYSGGTLNDDPDRRLLYAAIINCDEHADKMQGTSGGTIPVEAFASVFLTEPLENGSNTDGDDSIRAELVDITGRFGGGTLDQFLRDDIQLYR